MNNVVEAINEIIKGVNNAYSRGAYSMAEAHDLHEAIEYIKSAASTPQQPMETGESNEPAQSVKPSNKRGNKEKDDY
jgi:hypothetical protein